MRPHFRDRRLFLTFECLCIDWQTRHIPSPYKVTLCLLPTSCAYILYMTSVWKMWSEISLCAHVTSDVFVRVIVRTRPRREDDSKCHFLVWGQPSQTHSSCRRCCHPLPHCLCKWCLQSPSNTWRFHPPSVTLLLCLLLQLYKLSHRPSAPAVSHLSYHSLLKRLYLKGRTDSGVYTEWCTEQWKCQAQICVSSLYLCRQMYTVMRGLQTKKQKQMCGNSIKDIFLRWNRWHKYAHNYDRKEQS